MRRRVGAVFGFLLIFLGMEVFAKVPALEDPLLKSDFSTESGAGATNAATGIGNGRLTVGISPWSELIYFRWPSPSYYDHLRYLTKHDILTLGFFPKDMRWDERAPSLDWRRYGRPYEVYPGLGARGGIYFTDKSFGWFGDESWTSQRGYEPEWSPVLCTSLARSQEAVAAGKKSAKVKVCQWVDWDNDLLVQDFFIDSGSAEKFFYYGTFDPYDDYDSRTGYFDSPKAGFATLYLPGEQVILSFIPKNKDRSKLESAGKEDLTAALIDRLYPEGGIFIAMALLDRPDGFQVGADQKGIMVPGSAPQAASEDSQDGRLSGSGLFLGHSDSGLEKSITGQGRVVVLISAGPSAEKAIDIIEKARVAGADALKLKAVSDWKPIADRVSLPAQAGDVEKRVARRSILNLFVGRDQESGGIIASPSHQPNYHSDWPRDGSFYDLALDLAGFSELVTSHLDFYRRWQRKEKMGFHLVWLSGLKSPFYSPRGHWYSNMYTDGTPADMKILPVEIDETALLVWDLWRHEQFLPESDRAGYQKKYLETLTLGADAIADYVDLEKGWTRRVFEDDNAPPSATLHGAASVLAGLSAAIDAGKRWGADPAKIDQWRRAAIALRQGMLRRVTDPKTLEQSGWRGIQWTLFPAPVFESYDDPAARELIQRLAKNVEESADKKRAGFAYLGEQVFILRIATVNDPSFQGLIERAVNILTNEVPMPGADCFGEVTIWIDIPGQGKVAQQRTSIPHLWTGITSYLSVESLYRPERFRSMVPPVPK